MSEIECADHSLLYTEGQDMCELCGQVTMRNIECGLLGLGEERLKMVETLMVGKVCL